MRQNIANSLDFICIRLHTCAMDILGSLLNGPRAQGAFLLRSVMESPWSMRIEDEAPLTVIAIAAGSAWVAPDDAAPEALGPGDVAIVRGPGHYVMSSDPAISPEIVIGPGQVCTTLYGAGLAEEMSLGVRSWGNDPGGSTVMLTGTYQQAGEVSKRLLTALPHLVILRDGDWDCPIIDWLATEIVRNEPGQDAVLDRLLDLLLISLLRTWFGRPDGEAPQWYRAQSDPVAGRALRLIHNNPAHGWTVANLAAAVGSSRAALSRRFSDLVGVPPMSYITGWRLALAADLLCDTGETLESVARQVGYSSAFALSAAFKRERGVSPRHYRATMLAS